MVTDCSFRVPRRFWILSLTDRYFFRHKIPSSHEATTSTSKKLTATCLDCMTTAALTTGNPSLFLVTHSARAYLEKNHKGGISYLGTAVARSGEKIDQGQVDGAVQSWPRGSKVHAKFALAGITYFPPLNVFLTLHDTDSLDLWQCHFFQATLCFLFSYCKGKKFPAKNRFSVFSWCSNAVLLDAKKLTITNLFLLGITE